MSYSVGYKFQGREKVETISDAQFRVLSPLWADNAHRYDRIAIGKDFIQVCDIKSMGPQDDMSESRTRELVKNSPSLNPDRLRAGWIRAIKEALAVNPGLFQKGSSLNPKKLIEFYAIAPEEVGLPTGAW